MLVVILLLFSVVVFALAGRLLRIDRRERGEEDDGWNWGGWNGPKDWPKLPRAPKGSGPPDTVPESWVFEALGQPRKLIIPKKEPEQ
jgi:hypothetical protein